MRNSKKDILLRWGIAPKFILAILLFSSLVTVSLTLIQLYNGYKYGLGVIDRGVRQVEVSYLDSIENDLWLSDTDLLQIRLNGMMKLKDVQYIDIVDNQKTIAKVGVFTEENVIVKEFPLTYTYAANTISLGTLHVRYTLDNLYRHLKKNAISDILLQSVVILLVSGFFFFIFYLLVARHLYALVDYSKSLSVKTLDTPFRLKRSKNKWGEDEFDILVKAINEMRMDLSESYSRLKKENIEKLRVEKALTESGAHLYTLVNSIPDLVWLKDQNGVYLSCNTKFEEFFGAKEEEIIGKTDYDFVPKDLADSFRERDHFAMVAGAPCINEEEIVFAADGHREHLETVKNPIFSSDGSITGVLGVARDITARKIQEEEKIKLENRLQQSQKMESIGTLAGGIAHDFNNILAAIIGYTEMAREECPPESTIFKNLSEVLNAGHRAKNLVRQILAFSRQDETECIQIQPASIVKEVITMLRPSLPTTIEITQNIDSDLCFINVDPTQLNQILMNLCTNAFHAMEETGGILDVSLKEVTLSRDDLIHEPDVMEGTFLQLSISDSGPGIPVNIKERVFDPYFTTKEVGKGTGMGLATVHGIVKKYNGFISCYSKVNEGTIFHVFLPLETKEQMVGKEIGDEALTGKERILFVDDEEILATMASTMLEKLGYQVTVSKSGFEALETFQNRADQFDLIITDQTMPDMTGYDLSRRILQIRPDIPIILCTGYSTTISEEKAKLMGIKEFALKPLARGDIAKLIRKVLDVS